MIGVYLVYCLLGVVVVVVECWWNVKCVVEVLQVDWSDFGLVLDCCYVLVDFFIEGFVEQLVKFIVVVDEVEIEGDVVKVLVGVKIVV